MSTREPESTPPPRSAKRCPGCGSTLRPGGRHCDVCGEPVPWRLTPFGVVGELMAILLLVVALTGGLLVLRTRGGPGLSEAEQRVAALPVVSPTSAPTFTALPPPSPTLAPNTPVPPTSTPLPRVITYTVVSGDTLLGIAQQFSVSSDDLMTANQDTLDSPHSLHIGQQLRVPVQPPPQVADAGGAEGEPPASAAPADGDPASDVPAEGDSGETGSEPPPAEGETDGAPAVATVDPAVLRALGLPEEVAAPRKLPSPSDSAAAAPQSVPGETNPEAVLMTEKVAAAAFPRPVAVAPADGASLTGEAPVLRWSSAGLLPRGAYYVVSIREAGNVTAEPRHEWVLSNATALRMPGELRPPLGTSRTFEWSVAVRRRTTGLLGAQEGELLSPSSEPREVVWSP